ncbi:uncharacterized protein LOC130907748 isoform X1 [Corythoichthys intestinalis]|uniref:uncharacterized protein LOC130907748 isoform X1 n=1 Tax=Corythoichthys intestinalis TaxID=161448 RepID=UPI0025A63286|nr:uncharacterized protein LOC130907748 isoform X1 [Corythoichthys intestinalis]
MGTAFGFGWLFLLWLLGNVNAQKTPSPHIEAECLGNILRVDVRPLPGQFLEVSAVVGNSAVKLTRSLAKRCGFSMVHKQGTIAIYASLYNCFVRNVRTDRTIVLNLRLHSKSMAQDDVYQVAETCNYIAQVSREIICDRNYMEVSVKRTVPHDYTLPRRNIAKEKLINSRFTISSLVFFTPEEKKMTLQEAHIAGYGVANTASRLVLRSGKTASETYIQHVAGVPMTVLQAAAIFENKWFKSQIDVAAACPQLEGSVYFTQNMISWFLPTRIDPLISSGQFRLLEVHMGVDGKRLDSAKMVARHINMTVDDMYIVLHIPIGAPGGFFTSQVRDNEYLVSYMIEPMLELLWLEDATNEDTSYKVLFPIMTPPEPHHFKVQDDTVPEEKVFKIAIGPFASDVVLLNITFIDGVVSVDDCNERGFNVQERYSQSSGLKYISLKVPFTDRAVQQTKGPAFTLYSLQMTFGFGVLPKFTPFCHTTKLEAKLAGVAVLFEDPTEPIPSATGGCDNRNFYILVQYGSQGNNFQTRVGKRSLSQALAEEYGFSSNKTHFSIVVPFSSPDTVYEAIEGSSIRGRLDITLLNPDTKRNLNDFTLTCLFYTKLTECFPNGTMTAFAVKLESVPSMKPSQLTLLDPKCGPVYSNDRYAYFVFTGSTCGTTRKFVSNVMLYENEIALSPEFQHQRNGTDEPEFDLRVSCHYVVNTSRSVTFHSRARRNDPYAENGRGQLQVVLRLSMDDSYTSFYGTADYPVSKYLQHPLYFEVALMRSTNPRVSLELESCWATIDKERTSKPRWNLIINGCPNPVDPNQVRFHSVLKDDRVAYPSHVKRFEVQMFAFAQDKDNLNKQLYVHCDVEICDHQNRLSEVCKKRLCYSQDNRMKVQKRATSNVKDLTQVSSGCIHLN